MKILLGITYYSPNISGVSIYARRLAEGLASKGHEVTVITSKYRPFLPEKEKINGVQVVRCPVTFRIGKGVFMLSFPFKVFSLAQKIDVINCHLPQFESFVLAIIGRILRKKVVLTHHTDLSGWKGLFNRLAESTVWLGQLIAGIFCDKIVPYTKDYADYSWYLQLFKNKLEYILPPILTYPVNQKLQSKIKEKIGETVYIIGFAGRIAKQKGIPYLLNSIPFLEKKLRNFKIVFAGPYKEVIGENYYKQINHLIQRYRSRLCFLGSLKEEEMSSFYSLCNVLVLPSDDRLESFGLVQVEAMLNGCPVVATDLPGARMPVKMTKMGEIAKVGDPADLADKIAMVVKNPQKYKKSKIEIEKIFNYQKTITDYEKLFKTN